MLLRAIYFLETNGLSAGLRLIFEEYVQFLEGKGKDLMCDIRTRNTSKYLPPRADVWNVFELSPRLTFSALASCIRLSFKKLDIEIVSKN